MEAVVLILGFCGILSFAALKNNFFGLKLLAGMSWIGFVIFWTGNPLPIEFPEGGGAHTAIMVIAIGFALMIVLAGLGKGIQKTKKWDSGEETSEGFKLQLPDWLNMSKDSPEERRNQVNRELEEYEDKMDRALRIGRYNNRRR